MNEIEKTVQKRFIQVIALMFLFIGLTIIIIVIVSNQETRSNLAESYIISATEPYITPKEAEITDTARSEQTEQTGQTTELPAEPVPEYYIPQEIIDEWEAENPIVIRETARPTEAAAVRATAAPARVIQAGDIIRGNATHYAVCCDCDEPNTKRTANGHVLQNGVQCYTATGNWLPFGAVIEVGGVHYTIRDRGGRWFNSIGNIDIFIPEGRQTALRLGRLRNIEIKIVSLP